MSDLTRWLPDPPELGGFRFGEGSNPLAHLSDRELIEQARRSRALLVEEMGEEEVDRLESSWRRRGSR